MWGDLERGRREGMPNGDDHEGFMPGPGHPVLFLLFMVVRVLHYFIYTTLLLHY